MTRSGEVVLEGRSLSKTYHGGEVPVRALRDVSLSVIRQDLLAVVGRSGSGKSTLLQILGCLDRPDDGELRIGGHPATGLDDAELAQLRGSTIGFVFQQFSLLPRTSALDNAALPLVYARVPRAARREQARAVLERLGLGDRLHHSPSALSGGQQQRVAVARALIRDPAIILADEPTGSLDSASSDELMRLFLELNAEGRSIIIVTHDPKVAAVATRVIEMEDGRMISDSRRGPR